MEARIPIAQDQAFAESLSFDTAYRYSDYGDGVQTDTYKFGLEWAPVADVRLRGSYQRAVRAANIVELFTAQGFNLFDAPGDPCGAAARDPEASDAECIATGVPASQVGSAALDSPAGQYQFLQGGNTEPDARDFGYVLLRHRVPAALGAGPRDHGRLLRHQDRRHDHDVRRAEHLDGLLRQQRPGGLRSHQPQPERASCGSATGHVQDLNINIGSLSTTGYDVNIGYTGLEMGRFGSLSFNLTGTYLVDLITQPAPGVDLRSGSGQVLATRTTASASTRRSA